MLVSSRPRLQPVDVEAAEFQKMKPGDAACSGAGHEAADADVNANLKKFARRDNMAAEPNRSKGNESGQRP